jgi:heme/copper-type cytochrome/quinol oxidase subunit 4
MFTDKEDMTTVRVVELTLNLIVAISCCTQLVLFYLGLRARNLSVKDGGNMKALIRFYYGILLSPFFVCTVSDIAADWPAYASWIFSFVQIFVAIYFLMFLSLMVVSSGGWFRLKDFLRIQPDRTRPWWFFLRFKNAWYGLLSRYWMCQLIFFKPFANLLIAGYYWWYGYQSHSKLVTLINAFACVCTLIPVIGIAMFNYTLTQTGLIAFKHTEAKVLVLRILTPITQFAQTILELLVARGRITGNEKCEAMELGHRMLSFILSVSMVIVSLMTFWAYRPSDFEEITEERLMTLSLQRLQVEYDDGWIDYGGDEVSVLASSEDVYPQDRDVDLYMTSPDLTEKLIIT